MNINHLVFLTACLAAPVAATACDSSATKPAASAAADGGGGGVAATTTTGSGMTTTMGIGGCSADCEAQYGDGAAALAALEACIYCEACFDLCEPQGYCPNGGIEGGCSAMFQECGACAYSACSWTFDGSSFSGVCAAPYQACDTHPNCNNLWSCRNGC